MDKVVLGCSLGFHNMWQSIENLRTDAKYRMPVVGGKWNHVEVEICITRYRLPRYKH